MKKGQLTQYKIITITAVLVVLACSFAIYLRLFTEKELWYEMFAAVLGVIITAIITMILLRGQSDNDVERERASKIFGEKLNIYQEYLCTLCDVIKDRKLTDEEKIRLEFQTSYVAMHCDPAYIAIVSGAVRDLIKYCCPDESSEDQKRLNPNLSMSDSPDPLLNSLFCIVEAFRKDLYGDDFKFDDKDKDATLKNFSDAYRNAKSDDNSEGNEIAQQAEPTLQNHDVSHWDDALQKWNEQGWNLEGLSDRYDGFRLVNRTGNPGIINVGFWHGHYYIQASYRNDSDFSKPLKWEKGGRRNYGQWWQYLAEPYYDIPERQFVETFKSNKNLQQYITDYTNLLIDIESRHHRTVTWKDKVKRYKNWKIFIWYWDMLACEYENEEEGIPYMDT
ncbi:MAG TPA: hypothetical protein H9937_03990 [Candidatus Alistipes stercorigallinarum]|nr:hypothetical protein [Candidatus Alistipes stercorigallinarum]